jgi:ribosomal protein RSM22 (predicted rRNA methylase)
MSVAGVLGFPENGFTLPIAACTHLNEMGWFSAAFAPQIIMTSELAMSFQCCVIAPLPNESARPATVEECQRRAWCSR